MIDTECFSKVLFLLLVGLAFAPKDGHSVDQHSLVFASIVHRHGDRAPIHTFPKEQNSVSWYEGLGQLSKTGMKQAHRLGQFLHRRYTMENSFLFHNYTRSQLYVRSTDFERTLMTAQCLLAGMFVPDGSQEFISGLKWQPIPVHTVPKESDTLLDGANCPRLGQLHQELISSEEYKKINSDNKAFFRFLESQTGYPLVDLNKADLDRLLVAKSKERLKLVIGNLLETITNEMVQARELSLKQSNTIYTGKKIHFYSGHDSTLIPLLASFAAFSGSTPAYCSAFMVELYRDSQRQYFVEVWYKLGPLSQDDKSGQLKCNATSAAAMDTTGECLQSIGIPGCGQPCSLAGFQKAVQAMIAEDRDKECQLQSHSGFTSEIICHYQVPLMLWTVNVGFALFLLIVCIWRWCRVKSLRRQHSRQKDRMVYSRLKRSANDDEDESNDEEEG